MGSSLSQFFRIQFKGVRLESLAPICKREAFSAIFLLEASLPAVDRDVDRLYTKSFSFLVGLCLSLTNAGAVSTLSVLPWRWGGDVPGVVLGPNTMKGFRH